MAAAPNRAAQAQDRDIMAKPQKADAIERQPDAISEVAVDGHQVTVYSFWHGDEVLFCLNGGPGLPCGYVRDSHSVMADRGYRVVLHDQQIGRASCRERVCQSV